MFANLKTHWIWLALLMVGMFALALCACTTPTPTPQPPTPTAALSEPSGKPGVPPATKPTLEPGTKPGVPPRGSPTAASTDTPAFTLGVEERNEAGGYAYRPIIGYKIERNGKEVTLLAPGGDTKYGPMILFNPSTVTGMATPEDALAKVKSQMSGVDHFSEPRKTTVDGSPALVVDVKATVESKSMSARLVVVKPSTTRGLAIVAGSPADKWSEIEKPFEAVVASIKLFEPTSAAVTPTKTAVPTIPVGAMSKFITAAVMAKDVKPSTYEPIDITSTFGPEQSTYHAVVTLKDAPQNTQVKARWIAVSVSGIAPNTELGETELNAGGSQNLHYYNTPSAGYLSPGLYRVEIFVNEQYDRRISFTVISTSPTVRPTSTERATSTPRATSTLRPTSTPAASANPCGLQPGQSGVLFKNTYAFKVLLTIGGGEWGTHDYWFEPNSTTPIQFPPGSYTATVTIPGKGNYKFSNDKVTFADGKCTSITTP